VSSCTGKAPFNFVILNAIQFMRGILILVFFIGAFHMSLAQLPGNFNLVPNPGFEFNTAEYNNVGLPPDTSFINSRMCWIAPTSVGNAIYNIYNTSNYYTYYFKAHAGISAGAIETSLSYRGYALWLNGWLDSVGDQRTFQQTHLLQPLVAGTTYYFTMYIGEYKSTDPNLRGDDVLGNMGVYFSANKLSNYTYTNYGGSHGGLSVTPQIRFVNWDIPLFDTVMYAKLTAVYTATGGEQYMTIGNFDFFSQQHFVYVSPRSTALHIAYSGSGYPLIDDISLVSDTTRPMISLSEFSLGNDTVLCSGQSLTIGGQPNFFHYWWNTGDTTRFITVSQPGTYSCTIDYGCGTFTDTINLLSPIAVSVHIPDTALCPGQSYTPAAPPGYQHYLWSNNDTSRAVTLTDSGTYWLHISNNCGAAYTDTFHIINKNIPVAPFTIPDTALCAGQVYTAALPASYPHYLWSNTDTTAFINISTPGVYWLQVTNNCGNGYTDTFSVSQGISSITLGNDTVICNNLETYTLALPSGLSNILWSTGSTAPFITIVRPGTYMVQAQSVCGLFADTILVGFCSPAIDKITSTDTICRGECITVSAQTHNYPQIFSWSFPGGSPASYPSPTPVQVCYTDTGTYGIKLVVHSTGGSDSMANTVTVLPQPVPAFADSTITVTYNTILALPACATAMHIQWFNRDSLVCDGCSVFTFPAKVYQSIYQCVVSNAGCSATCTYKVMVTDIPTDVWMPNAFTPNGDGLNDYFHAITDNPNIVSLQLSVYNRYGQKVYEGVQDPKGWNGTVGGVPADAGTYFWYMRYKVLGSDVTYNKKGDVIVVR